MFTVYFLLLFKLDNCSFTGSCVCTWCYLVLSNIMVLLYCTIMVGTKSFLPRYYHGALSGLYRNVRRNHLMSSPHHLGHTAWRNDCSGPREHTWACRYDLPPVAGTPEKQERSHWFLNISNLMSAETRLFLLFFITPYPNSCHAALVHTDSVAE